MKHLGVDYGEKRVGLAVSDEMGRLAFPKVVLENTGVLLDRIKKIIDLEGIEMVVVGDSKNYNLKDNPIMEDIKSFSKELKNKTGLDVKFHPEFMTTAQAEKERQFALDRYNKKTKARHNGPKKDLDASAAAIILQNYLDSNR